MVFNSKDYWEQRYEEGGNSGAGSYGRLAEFKAEIINDFISKNNIKSVIELGCGDGNQLNLYKFPKYLGLDVSKKSISLCADIFSKDFSKSFFIYDSNFSLNPSLFLKADLSISIDVLFHLVEDDVFEKYMKDLFEMSDKFVIIYSSDFDSDKQMAAHVRHRNITKWIESNLQKWKLIKKIPNRYPLKEDPINESFADFFIYEKNNE
mgnify:CR=1 FL=1